MVDGVRARPERARGSTPECNDHFDDAAPVRVGRGCPSVGLEVRKHFDPKEGKHEYHRPSSP